MVEIKKTFAEPACEIEKFEIADVITTSGEGEDITTPTTPTGGSGWDGGDMDV